MNLQRIKAIDGRDEYVLLPVGAYEFLKKQIDQVLNQDYTKFELEEYVKNPVAIARIHAGLTQEELAERLEVSQAYISKIENQLTVPLKLMQKIKTKLKN